MNNDNKYYIYKEDGTPIYLGPFTVEIWNIAIEEAAKIADETDKDYHDVAAAKIRKLKK